MRNNTLGRGVIFDRLERQFRALKYRPEFIERVMPSWWTPEAESDPNGLDHLKLLLAQYLGLDIKALLSEDVVKPTAPTGMRFKRSSDLLREKPADPNLAFFSRVAKSVSSSIEPSVAIPTDAMEVHSEIVRQSKSQIVTLSAILEYCWSRNIAVVHIDEIPVKKAGLDALVYRVNDRYVIIVVRNDGPEASARAAFTIAHELGHIALGHISENLGLIDDPSDAERNKSEERQADNFAGLVLSGGRYKKTWRGRAKRADTLAERALIYQDEWQIDAGHIVWRCAFDRHIKWANANAACQHLPKLPSTAHDFINAVARTHIDSSRMSKDSQELLERTLVAA